ncbi:hypothetical protein H0H87_009477 [Tephrocybe sp. NHM501043]|nr:hypothetical protein H0H87_009477 [Tephrocybe sp. NHM501043]
MAKTPSTPTSHSTTSPAVERPSRIHRPKRRITQILASIVCLLAMGTTSLDRVIEITGADREEDFQKFKEALFARVSNVNVVSGLILATTAAFLTTDPPTQGVNWNKNVPYNFILAAFCIAFLGAGSGTFLLFVLSDVQSVAFRNLMQKPWHFWCALYLIGSPSLYVGTSGGTAIIGLCFAAWEGTNLVAKLGAAATLGMTALTVGTFFFVVS